MRFTRVRAVALGCLTSALVGYSQAQNYPSKVVRYIVPTSAGSGADTVGRIVAAGLTEVLGQQGGGGSRRRTEGAHHADLSGSRE